MTKPLISPNFVVACTTAYYPAIEFAETREAADAIAEKWRKAPPGQHYDPPLPVIVVASVASIETLPFPIP